MILHWRSENGKLKRTIVCRDFAQAISLINQIARIAEEENHHPDLELVEYNRLTISLVTHDEGGITWRDELLAERIENEVFNS
jgi:4a-hydroxytetrahydrobiopterin dehydratase